MGLGHQDFRYAGQDAQSRATRSSGGSTTTATRRRPICWPCTTKTRASRSASCCAIPWTTPSIGSCARHDLSDIEPLQTTVYDDGKLAYDPPPLEEIRRQRDADLERLDPGIRRLVNPHIYHVSLSQQLWDLKQELIEDARSQNMA